VSPTQRRCENHGVSSSPSAKANVLVLVIKEKIGIPRPELIEKFSPSKNRRSHEPTDFSGGGFLAKEKVAIADRRPASESVSNFVDQERKSSTVGLEAAI